jgi:hypothetical protein
MRRDTWENKCCSKGIKKIIKKIQNWPTTAEISVDTLIKIKKYSETACLPGFDVLAGL